MEFKIVLDKEEVLRYCEKNKNFEVYIQRAALNYIKNSRLKPLMREEIVREIELFKTDVKYHIESSLKEMGLRPEGWNRNYILLSDELKKELQDQVKRAMKVFIADAVQKELGEAYALLKKEITAWEEAVKFKCDTELTPAKLKTIAKEVLENKISLLK